MFDDLVLKMPKTESDSGEGINDANIETYKNKPMMSLSKEELQNSTDGAIRDDGIPRRVIVEFNEFYLPTENLPDINAVKTLFSAERKYWDEYLKNDKKAVKFFDKAIKVLGKDKIRCIRISDFNTTGLTGIKGQSTPWKNLVKNKGISDKPESATGSFGIGKAAAFGCSEIRTVFYNTVNTDEKDNEGFQGCIKLPSYSPSEGINFVGTGFFSKKSDDMKMEPIMENRSLDVDFKRTQTGMDKFIIGFPEELASDVLKREVIASSINNFLYAFWTDQLVVKYGDTVVEKGNLPKIIDEYEDALDKLTKEYFITLNEPDKTIELSLFEESDVKIFVKLLDDAGRRAAIVRQSGMKVFDKGNISGRISFSAVVVLLGDKVNGYFKELENPEHTGWAIDRASNKAEASRKQKEIFDAVRNAVDELHQENYSKTMDSDGTSEYLPMAYVQGKKKKTEGLSNEPELKKRAPKRKRKKPTPIMETEKVTYEEDEQGNILEETITIVPPDHEGSGRVGGIRENGEEERVPGIGGDPINLIETNSGSFVAKRKVADNNFSLHLKIVNHEYYLMIKCENKVKSGFIEVLASGETEQIALQVASASVDNTEARIRGNRIKFDGLEENITHAIVFKLKQPEEWAIEVNVYES